MRTSNPALRSGTFSEVGAHGHTMTVQGTVNKTFVLLLLVLAGAGYVWNLFFSYTSGWEQNLGGGAGAVQPFMLVGGIGGFLVALVTIFKKRWVVFTAPLYAILEGLFLGGFSALLEAQYPGIVIQAVGLTFGTLFSLLLAYKSGMIRATENFKLGVAAATGGIFLVYLVSMVLGFFGVSVPLIHSAGPMGILFSLFVVVIAALNLVLDFDFIEQGAYRGAPKYMEWYGAFGLLVTLIWLYLEILRLLAKTRGDRR